MPQFEQCGRVNRWGWFPWSGWHLPQIHFGATSGMAWHFPWHQYQITESGIETEGELVAPSMSLREARQDARFEFFRAEADFSNVSY